MAKINKQIVKRTALMRRIVSQMLFGPKQRFDQTAVLFCPNAVSPFFGQILGLVDMRTAGWRQVIVIMA